MSLDSIINLVQQGWTRYGVVGVIAVLVAVAIGIAWLRTRGAWRPLFRVSDVALGAHGAMPEQRTTKRLTLPKGDSVIRVTVEPSQGGEVMNIGAFLIDDGVGFRWRSLLRLTRDVIPHTDGLLRNDVSIKPFAIANVFPPIEAKPSQTSPLKCEMNFQPPYPKIVKDKPIHLSIPFNVASPRNAKFRCGVRIASEAGRGDCSVKLRG